MLNKFIASLFVTISRTFLKCLSNDPMKGATLIPKTSLASLNNEINLHFFYQKLFVCKNKP